jgi:hypothetical protein
MVKKGYMKGLKCLFAIVKFHFSDGKTLFFYEEQTLLGVKT